MKKEILAPNNIQYNSHKRHNEKIFNKEVEVGKGLMADSFLGSHFVDCVMRLRGAASITLHSTMDCTFENCLIWASRKHASGTWQAHFNNCSFRGHFELRFAHKLINCDFSKAKLSYVEFQSNFDMEGLAGIHFPHIAILNIKENFLDWDKITKPKDYKDLVWVSKKQRGMVVINLELCTKEPQKMWDSIKELPFVITHEIT